MRSTIAKRIIAKTSPEVKAKVRAYSKTKIETQPTLFGYIKPTSKVPISAERLRQAKALLQAGNAKGSAAILREVRYALEAFEKRITSKPQ